MGIRASFCQQKVVFLEAASKESCSAPHWAKPLAVNELCLAARKAIENGKYQYKKKQEKRGRQLFKSMLSKPRKHQFKNCSLCLELRALLLLLFFFSPQGQ